MQQSGMSGTIVHSKQGSDSKIRKKGGILTNKHTAAMESAEELLDNSKLEDNICDDLNCGKWSRLYRYIKIGRM